MYGSQTPMHDGSRTPHYGNMTPAYGQEGSRTPGGGLVFPFYSPLRQEPFTGASAWDPNVGNTPAHSSEDTGPDLYEEASPSPALQPPPTPGYAPETPGNPYTPGQFITGLHRVSSFFID